MTARGSYAKGVAKREEILAAALGIVAEHGYAKASVREIAAAVDLSPAGLLHYFGSKEDLYVAILKARDERDLTVSSNLGVLEATVATIRHNAQVPGLVHLYARLLADAHDPEHPAHTFFRERTAQFEGFGIEAITAAQAAGEIRADLDPAWIVRAGRALADGLQTAWMLDETIDMADDVEQFLRLLRP